MAQPPPPPPPGLLPGKPKGAENEVTGQSIKEFVKNEDIDWAREQHFLRKVKTHIRKLPEPSLIRSFISELHALGFIRRVIDGLRQILFPFPTKEGLSPNAEVMFDILVSFNKYADDSALGEKESLESFVQELITHAKNSVHLRQFVADKKTIVGLAFKVAIRNPSACPPLVDLAELLTSETKDPWYLAALCTAILRCPPDTEQYRLIEKILTPRMEDSFRGAAIVNAITNNVITKDDRKILLNNLSAALLRSDYIPLAVRLWGEVASKERPVDDFPFYSCVSSLWSITDCATEQFLEKLTSSPFFDLVVKVLSRFAGTEEPVENEVMYHKQTQGVLVIMWNCARVNQVARKQLYNAGSIPLLSEMSKNEDPVIRCLAVKCLAAIGDSDEKQIFATTSSNIEFLLDLARKALELPSHLAQFGEFGTESLEELLDGLERIALNDVNKRLLIEADALSLIEGVLKDAQNATEKRRALELLWALSFCEEKKSEIIHRFSLLQIVMAVESEADKETKAVLEGIEWELFGKKDKGGKSEGGSQGHQHVMISYNWGVQETALRLKQHLEGHGVKVWIDVECMGDDLNDSMAQAVESSDMVVVCATRAYQESKNCRKEAKYADKLNKRMKFLIAEKDYSPTSWLGVILSDAIYMPCFTPDSVPVAVNALLEDLEPTRHHESNIVPTTNSKASVEVQTKITDVKLWLAENDCASLVDKIGHLKPRQFAELIALKKEVPNFYYDCLQKYSLSVDEILSLNSALRSIAA